MGTNPRQDQHFSTLAIPNTLSAWPIKFWIGTTHDWGRLIKFTG